jgi:hypothetical protein
MQWITPTTPNPGVIDRMNPVDCIMHVKCGLTQNPAGHLRGRRLLLGFLLAAPFGLAQAADWPGAPPDCWAESRLIHGHENQDAWQKNIAITQVRAERPKAGTFSPNKAYYFVPEGGGRPDARITIYAEKNHLTQIAFSNLFGLTETKWINEKLLIIRPWWGRMAGTDIIFDVEMEKIIYAESVTDGYMAYQQYKEDCRQTGCECIKKK